jgi:DNA excision repair protein ERCC-2
MEILFAHDSMRPEQARLVQAVQETIESGGQLLAHAPTGLGKTAATLCPALTLAEKKGLTIFYLTSRNTQHKIVLETVSKLKEKYNKHFVALSIVGKQKLCLQDNISSMRSGDFATYCKQLREAESCSYYTNVKDKNGVRTGTPLVVLKNKSPCTSQMIYNESANHDLCPYEMSLLLAQEAHVIVCDYFYLFNPTIRKAFLTKVNKKLENCIIIVDEGHNLPDRLRDVMTKSITSRMIKAAITETKNHDLADLTMPLFELESSVSKLGIGGQERLIKKNEFSQLVKDIKPYNDFLEELTFAGELVLTDKKVSRLAWIASFLDEWNNEDEGFARIVKKDDYGTHVTLRCLDPGMMSRHVFSEAHSTILMSGTLTPPSMYKDILGFTNPKIINCKSPFAASQKLSMIVPKTTTKYSKRSEQQYKRIAAVCAQIANRVPGNVIIFFPSYRLRDLVYEHFVNWYDRNIFLEQPGMSTEQKEGILHRYSAYKDEGSALLGVSTGSFGEGIDLPGVIKGILVVGLPLDRPDLETQELIAYYDRLFGKGWDYGYILPAMNRTFQNAGRCIRTEEDRGIIAFIDERYAWNQYKKAFPSDWDMQINEEFNGAIEDFFSLH